jgi:hypothetical protein
MTGSLGACAGHCGVLVDAAPSAETTTSRWTWRAVCGKRARSLGTAAMYIYASWTTTYRIKPMLTGQPSGAKVLYGRLT